MDGPQVIIKLILRCSWGSSCRNMFWPPPSACIHLSLSLFPLPSCTRWNNRIYLYAPLEGVAHVRLLKRFHPEYIHPPSLHSRFLFVLFSSRRHVASLAVSFSKLTRGGVFNLIRECFRNRAERVVKFSSLVTFLFFFQREREEESLENCCCALLDFPLRDCFLHSLKGTRVPNEISQRRVRI